MGKWPATLWTYGDPKTRRRSVEALDDIDQRLAARLMLRHKLWHASKTVWQLNLEAVSLHAYPSLPATPLADGHDRGDRRRDRMRGLGDAGQYAAAPHRDGDGAGRQRLRGGRQALPLRAREGRRGGATSLDRRLGGNRSVSTEPAVERSCTSTPAF